MGDPTEADLQQVATIIQTGLNYMDRAGVERANQFLQEHSPDPKFNTCLAVVACSAGRLETGIRAQAALQLKNNITRNFESAIKPNVESIRTQLKSTLADPDSYIRGAVASCISEIARTGAWPQLVQELWPQLQASQSDVHRQGILLCIRDACEYCTAELEEGGVQCQAVALIPALLQLITSSNSTKEVLLAVRSLFHLLDYESLYPDDSPIDKKCHELLAPILEAMGRCVSMAGGADGLEIMVYTLKCYRLMLYYYESLKQLGRLSSILQLIYKSTSEQDARVSLAACEFWHDLSDNVAAVNDLKDSGLVHELTKLLLDKMVFSDLEVSLIEEEEEAVQVRPRGSKKHKGDEEDDDEEVDQWTVRKCAASTLDALSSKLGLDLITPPGQQQGWLLESEIKVRMRDANWKRQESAILAFGAIQTGCYIGVRNQLPEYIAFLLGLLENPNNHFLARSMSCWTLGRYIDNIARDKAHFERFLTVLLKAMSEPKRKVQECAVSSFAILLEFESQNDGYLSTNPAYVNAILEHIHQCLMPGRYTIKNMAILLDAIGHLAYSVGESIVSQEGDRLLFQPLIRLLGSTPDDDQDLLPQLLYCFYNIVHGLGERVPYVPEIYTKSLSIVGKFFQLQFSYKKGEIPEAPDMGQNPHQAVDLIKSLIEVMQVSNKAAVDNLVLNTKYPGTDFGILDLIMLPISQPQLDVGAFVIMTAVNFVGEHMRSFNNLLGPVVQSIPQVLEHCKQNTELCNDCAWYCGEVALVLDSSGAPEDQVKHVVATMAAVLVPIVVQQTEWDVNLLRNVALAIGKFGLVQPGLLAPQLGSFFKPVALHLADVLEMSVEKPQAFLGMVRLLQGNFSVLQDMENVRALAKGMNSFRTFENKPDLQQAFVETLKALKGAVGQQWSSLVGSISFPQSILVHVQ